MMRFGINCEGHKFLKFSQKFLTKTIFLLNFSQNIKIYNLSKITIKSDAVNLIQIKTKESAQMANRLFNLLKDVLEAIYGQKLENRVFENCSVVSDALLSDMLWFWENCVRRFVDDQSGFWLNFIIFINFNFVFAEFKYFRLNFFWLNFNVFTFA